MTVPKFDELMNPILKALKQLGGSGSIQEIEDAVAKLLRLSEEDLKVSHRGNLTKFSYRLAWTRNYLKRYGLLENSSRGVWALTPEGLRADQVDALEVKKSVRRMEQRLNRSQEETENQTTSSWDQQLIEQLMRLEPPAFERLCQRVLRESGFTQVEVTGKSGDGGIDGRGVVRIGGLLSFHVIFQCKRYSRSVSAAEIRDFRGAMVGRADKGLFITTSTFTRDAWQEATRDGAPPIDLIDGEALALKMRELGMGVKITTQEIIEVEPVWFDRFKS